MAETIEAAPAVGAAILLAMAAGLAGLLVWASTGSDAPTWTEADLASFAAIDSACPVCGGRHCAGCEAPAPITASPSRHVAHHDIAGVPPSIAAGLALMTPSERAHELVRQLHAATWTPYRGLPTRVRTRLTAATVARRNRVPLLLGTFARPVGTVLP